MKALIQRVKHARVDVDGQCVGEIKQGILVLLGVEKPDDEQVARKLADKLIGYRIFEDEEGKMNLNVQQISGQLLVVSQFTLVADTRKGTRPSFSSAAPPVQGRALYEYFVSYLKDKSLKVQTGQFGADMKVGLLNDGPVTFMLEA